MSAGLSQAYVRRFSVKWLIISVDVEKAMVLEHCPEAGHSSGVSICFARCLGPHIMFGWSACSGIIYIVCIISSGWEFCAFTLLATILYVYNSWLVHDFTGIMITCYLKRCPSTLEPFCINLP